MLWQVRALLDDRPGAMAALAASCGSRAVNILGLQIFPAADGRVIDELVMHTPGGWTAADVEQLCALAGVDSPRVVACSPRALEDQPVRYLRAAAVIMERPELLEQQLCSLLDALPVDGLPGLETLLLDDEYGPRVELTRTVRFTDTEVARASELRRLAALALGTAADPRLLLPAPEASPGSGQILLRRGSAADAGAVMAMHDRCSAEAVYRRYHAPVPHVSPRLARSLLEPEDGLSLVLTVGDQVVAVGVLVPHAEGADLGLLVEDRWQRQGYGAKMLRALAAEAAGRGVETLTCDVQPDNEAVLRTISRAGLRARVTHADGFIRYRIPVRDVTGPRVSSTGRPSACSTTSDVTARVRQT